MPRRLRALAAAAHGGPTSVVTVVTLALGLASGLELGRAAIVAVMILLQQLSIGWSNDALDAARDTADGRADKPIARGDLSARLVLGLAAGAAVAAVALSLLLGPGAAIAHAVFLLAGWAYNAGLKRGVLATACYAIGFGALPLIVTLAAPEPRSAQWWAIAMGALLGYRGGVVVIQGQGFANALSQYDDFAPGDFFDPGSMVPLSLTVDDFDVEFIKEGRAIGAAHKFAADLTYRETPEGPEKHRTIRVNHPLEVDGTSVYLLSHGYAPRITVRDGQGRVALSGPVVFLPQDATFTSFGVVKVPDTVTREGKPLQLGFEGELYPTYGFTMETGPFSAFPEAKDPLISMTVWRGDLGMDTGVPQSVFALQKDGLDAVEKADGKPLRVDLPMGGTVQLPDGMGSITFEGISPFVRLQVSTSPGDWIALLGVSLALLGLMLSLFIRPRRVWVRLTGRPGGPTLVEVAGLDRSSGGDLGDELDRVLARISGEAQS